ncbi:MAG TPA: hypothetical protein PK129_01650 [Cellvibrionaceae bacterium]|nr:hypothetical protein [Cellvibrionaceae bacterium]
MDVVLAYQSLNSNSSTEHDVAASTRQAFQRAAQHTLAPMYPKGTGVLRYPFNPQLDPSVILEGPAELVPVGDKNYLDDKKPSKKRKRDEADTGDDLKFAAAKSEMLSMVEGKARQLYQFAYREVGATIDAIVFGELDSTHTQWQSISKEAGKKIHVSVRPKACNCFSIHGPSGITHPIAEGEGWCAVRCKGVLAVFVHVPNSLAANKDAATVFYQNIKNTLLNHAKGGVVDVFIGDTNQPRETFSPEVISSGMDQTFVDAHSGGITLNDIWAEKPVVHKGTNSANNKKFDVAVYNTATVKKIEVKYISQFSFAGKSAVAYTDHMGVLVKVEKK